MAPALDNLGPGARVLLVRLRSLGDCVLTTPALELLHAFRPDLQVAVVVEPRFAAVFEHHPAVDAILEPLAARIRAWRPELAVNLHGGTRSAWLTLSSRARVRAGFGHHRFAWSYHVRIPRAQEILGEERVVHMAEHLASALFYLGVPRTEIPKARLYGAEPPRRAPYAVLHPFAAAEDKRWPAERFVELGRHFRRAHGLDVVVLGAAGDDFSPFAEFGRIEGAPLGEVKGWIAGARIFVGNDSGPAHMAAALGVPAVVLFGRSDPRIWGPWRAEAAVALHAPEGLEAIPVERVAEAAEGLRARTW